MIFLTNGFDTRIDDGIYPERRVAAFYSKRDLEKLFNLRTMRTKPPVYPGKPEDCRAVLPGGGNQSHLPGTVPEPPEGFVGDGHRLRKDPDGDRLGGCAFAARLGQKYSLSGGS